ncbi:hypothetical protein D3C71_1962920 [compost metagenome]
MRDMAMTGLGLFKVFIPFQQSSIRTDFRLRHTLQRLFQLVRELLILFKNIYRFQAIIKQIRDNKHVHSGT